MARKSRGSKHIRVRVDRYDAMLTEMVGLLEAARRMSARAINAVITNTYWQIGRRSWRRNRAVKIGQIMVR